MQLSRGLETQHRLEPNFWAKILLVRYKDHPAGHAYCVWETDGTIYGYDRNGGAFPIPIYTREPKVIAAVLADELSKVLNEPLTVAQAEFVEPRKSDLYKFCGLCRRFQHAEECCSGFRAKKSATIAGRAANAYGNVT